MPAKEAQGLPLVIARAAATPEASAPSSPCEDRRSKASAASPHAIQPCPHTVSSHAPPAGDTCGADQSVAAPAKPPRLGRAPKRVTKCSWHRSRRLDRSGGLHLAAGQQRRCALSRRSPIAQKCPLL